MRQLLLILCIIINGVFSATVYPHSALQNARFVSLDGEEKTLFSKRSDEDILISYLSQNNVFEVENLDQIKLRNSFESNMGTVHYYEQEVNGYKVIGASLKLLERDGKIESISGTFVITTQLTKPKELSFQVAENFQNCPFWLLLIKPIKLQN